MHVDRKVNAPDQAVAEGEDGCRYKQDYFPAFLPAIFLDHSCQCTHQYQSGRRNMLEIPIFIVNAIDQPPGYDDAIDISCHISFLGKVACAISRYRNK